MKNANKQRDNLLSYMLFRSLNMQVSMRLRLEVDTFLRELEELLYPQACKLKESKKYSIQVSLADQQKVLNINAEERELRDFSQDQIDLDLVKATEQGRCYYDYYINSKFDSALSFAMKDASIYCTNTNQAFDLIGKVPNKNGYLVNKKCDSFSYKVVITIFNLQWTKSISFSEKNPENCKTKYIENTYFIGNTYNDCIHEYKVAIIDQTYGAIIYKDEIEQKIQEAINLKNIYYDKVLLNPDHSQKDKWIDTCVSYINEIKDYEKKLE